MECYPNNPISSIYMDVVLRLWHSQMSGVEFESFYAKKDKKCIKTLRYRKNSFSQSLEAKILFDADKLNVAGSQKIARILLYKRDGRL